MWKRDSRNLSYKNVSESPNLDPNENLLNLILNFVSVIDIQKLFKTWNIYKSSDIDCNIFFCLINETYLVVNIYTSKKVWAKSKCKRTFWNSMNTRCCKCRKYITWHLPGSVLSKLQIRLIFSAWDSQKFTDIPKVICI